MFALLAERAFISGVELRPHPEMAVVGRNAGVLFVVAVFANVFAGCSWVWVNGPDEDLFDPDEDDEDGVSLADGPAPTGM